MKKILMRGAAVAMVLTVGLTTAFAAGGRNYVDANRDGICDNRGIYCQYVDANGDGVCDNRGTYCRYVDANGDGVCDNWGTYSRYVDANGDGICDNWGGGCHGQGRGRGCHSGW